MKIVRGGKVLRLHDLLLFVGKLLRLYSNSKHLIIKKKKFAGKLSRLEANPRKLRKFSTANDLHYTVYYMSHCYCHNQQNETYKLKYDMQSIVLTIEWFSKPEYQTVESHSQIKLFFYALAYVGYQLLLHCIRVVVHRFWLRNPT